MTLSYHHKVVCILVQVSFWLRMSFLKPQHYETPPNQLILYHVNVLFEIIN